MVLIFNNKPIKPTKESNINIHNEGYVDTYYSDIIAIEESYIGIIKDSYAIDRIAIEDGFTELVSEGLQDMISEIKKWFDKFIEFIKKAFNAIIVVFESIFMDTLKFFNKYKSKVNFDGEFDVTGFEYKMDLISSVPNLQPLHDVVRSFNDFSAIGKMKDEDYKEKIQNFLEDSNLNELRRSITGVSGVTSDNIKEEVRKAFRSGKESIESIKINKSKALDIINNFQSLKTAADKAKKDERELENTLSSLKSYFERGANRYKTGDKEFSAVRSVDVDGNKHKLGDKEELTNSASVINSHFRYHYIQTKEISGMISLTIHEKVLALKEAVKLHASIGKKAIMKSGVAGIKEEGDK